MGDEQPKCANSKSASEELCAIPFAGASGLDQHIGRQAPAERRGGWRPRRAEKSRCFRGAEGSKGATPRALRRRPIFAGCRRLAHRGQAHGAGTIKAGDEVVPPAAGPDRPCLELAVDADGSSACIGACWVRLRDSVHTSVKSSTATMVQGRRVPMQPPA